MTLTSAAYIDSALARGTVYQCLAQACYYPTDVFADSLTQGLWQASLDEAVNALEGSEVLHERLASLELVIPTSELSGLRAEYTQLFSNTALTDFPPYGANYLASHIFMKAQSLADVTGFYRAFGVDLEAGTERPDHVSVELEFMGYLCLKEAYAADHTLAEALDITMSAQRRFLAEHLGRWAPLFMRRFEAVSSQPFYRALALFAQAFLAAEQARLGVSPEPIAELPVDTAAPGDVTCGVNGDKCPLDVSASASMNMTR